ncbi:hypothetical protein HGR01_11660 [Tolypothrix sp. PCC 7712]|nr:hypothetical protein HGR01_11660 [Tolypothrix sp. PCC 7712]
MTQLLVMLQYNTQSLRIISTVRLQYCLISITAFGDADPSGTGFTATGASTFTDDLTLEKFLNVRIQENHLRMSKYDSRLLKPELIPKLARMALRTLQFILRKRVEGIGDWGLGIGDWGLGR